MRILITYILIIIVLSGCELRNETAKTPYFEFDRVEYYFKDISEDDLHTLRDDETEHNVKYFELVEVNYPENLKDGIDFSKDLTLYGYSKSIINQSKFNEIQNIFSQKECDNGYAAACIPVYRDIFIFYKNDSIVGIVKICFDCRLFQIVGTDKDTGNFGQCDDFEKLEKLIK